MTIFHPPEPVSSGGLFERSEFSKESNGRHGMSIGSLVLAYTWTKANRKGLWGIKYGISLHKLSLMSMYYFCQIRSPNTIIDEIASSCMRM